MFARRVARRVGERRGQRPGGAGDADPRVDGRRVHVRPVDRRDSSVRGRRPADRRPARPTRADVLRVDGRRLAAHRLGVRWADRRRRSARRGHRRGRRRPRSAPGPATVDPTEPAATRPMAARRGDTDRSSRSCSRSASRDGCDLGIDAGAHAGPQGQPARRHRDRRDRSAAPGLLRSPPPVTSSVGPGSSTSRCGSPAGGGGDWTRSPSGDASPPPSASDAASRSPGRMVGRPPG